MRVHTILIYEYENQLNEFCFAAIETGNDAVDNFIAHEK
jgi:hypothetical protein